MNIWGHQRKIKELKRELKKGKDELGLFRYNKLEKLKLMHEHLILKIRGERKNEDFNKRG